jgi:exonuclease III
MYVFSKWTEKKPTNSIHRTLENTKNFFFCNLVRYLYPDERDAYTFWSYFRNARSRNIGWRLDYFIISSRLQENLCDVIHQTGVYGSDHCPIVLLLSV